jgi:hypothetical protein
VYLKQDSLRVGDEVVFSTGQSFEWNRMRVGVIIGIAGTGKKTFMVSDMKRAVYVLPLQNLNVFKNRPSSP